MLYLKIVGENINIKKVKEPMMMKFMYIGDQCGLYNNLISIELRKRYNESNS